jgi:hypothetical protein
VGGFEIEKKQEKLHNGTGSKLREGKVSDGQSATEPRDALERIGPAELEKV